MGKKYSLRVPGQYARIRDVCRFVRDGAAAAGFDEDELFRLELACDEACTNVIEHAYGGENQGELTISYQVNGNLFEITIVDHGRAFTPEQIKKPDIPQSADEAEKLKVGGLGLHIIRQVMDSIEYTFIPGRNELVMGKEIPGAAG